MTPDLRFLLLQARKPGDAMSDHEWRCFADSLGVPGSSVARHDLLGGLPSERQLHAADMVLIGGSGDYSVIGSEPFVIDFLQFLDQVVIGQKKPTFASCFGFQGLIHAGGGTIVHDPANTEVGTYTISLTPEGRRDPIIGPIGPTFYAQLGHKDRADAPLPAGMALLAASERSPVQALRVEGAKVFATQFHPELSRTTNLERYQAYALAYTGSEASEDDEVVAAMRESPKATTLLCRWVEALFGD